jgi:hypothetical protein
MAAFFRERIPVPGRHESVAPILAVLMLAGACGGSPGGATGSGTGASGGAASGGSSGSGGAGAVGGAGGKGGLSGASGSGGAAGQGGSGSGTVTNQPGCYPDGWCWANPLPEGNQLSSVWGSSATNGWAVGDVGTILHFDGSFWAAVASNTTVNLHGVWGSSANDVWAVGEMGTILHWTGTAWAAVASGSTEVLEGVWGSAANDVWAVGGQLGTLLHWDGSSWTNVTNVGVGHGLASIWGSGASDVWAVGPSDNSFVHFDGKAWAPVTGVPSGLYSAVWGSGPNDVWAGGRQSLEHWDGKSWSATTGGASILGPSNVMALGGTGPNDAWALCEFSMTYHWDGTTWTAVTAPTPHQLEAVWGSSPGVAWGVGLNGWMVRFAGTTGTATNGTVEDLYAVWGTSDDDIWAAGQDPTVQHWDGKSWSPVAPQGSLTASYPSCNGIWGSSSTDVWFACTGGVIFHFDGTALTEPPGLPIPNTSTLGSVYGTGPNDVWAGGGAGTLAHFDGTSWTLSDSGTTGSISSVWAADPDHAWAIANGSILTWNGTAWSQVSGVGNQELDVVSGTAANDVWALGQQGVAAHWDGASWTASTVNGIYFKAAWGNAGTKDLWADGTAINGLNVMHWNGTTWTPVPSAPFTFTVKGIWASATSDVWVVGGGGAILHHPQ